MGVCREKQTEHAQQRVRTNPAVESANEQRLAATSGASQLHPSARQLRFRGDWCIIVVENAAVVLKWWKSSRALLRSLPPCPKPPDAGTTTTLTIDSCPAYAYHRNCTATELGEVEWAYYEDAGNLLWIQSGQRQAKTDSSERGPMIAISLTQRAGELTLFM